jgi:hypothetical protein
MVPRPRGWRPLSEVLLQIPRQQRLPQFRSAGKRKYRDRRKCCSLYSAKTGCRGGTDGWKAGQPAAESGLKAGFSLASALLFRSFRKRIISDERVQSSNTQRCHSGLCEKGALRLGMTPDLYRNEPKRRSNQVSKPLSRGSS